ncbi:MAG: Fic family protein, partial [Chloroflexi bacterium]|nr:Fic family protein [Chloroflexota bacterium]
MAAEDLRALGLVWQEQRARLADLDQYRQFEDRLRREWAIETGLIERLYTFDRGITLLLVERGIEASLIPPGPNADPEIVASMISDHKAVVDGLFDFITGERRLSVGYIRELHALMTRSQETAEGMDTLGRKVSVPLIRGGFKKLPNNPVRTDGRLHEYCPPEQVDSEMDRLIALH